MKFVNQGKGFFLGKLLLQIQQRVTHIHNSNHQDIIAKFENLKTDFLLEKLPSIGLFQTI